jgi:diguanylate cyclase (GGDEF)-like protein/PAS domain S-box-containing protein
VSIHEDNLLRSAVDAAPFAMFVCATDGILLAVNQAFERLTGYDAAELVNSCDLLALHDPYEVGRRETSGFWPLRPVPYEGEWTYIRSNQERLPVLLALSPFLEPKASREFYVGMVIDLSARRFDSARVWYATHHDELTQLPNQALLDERLGLMIQRCQRSREQFTVMTIELDNLRNLRDGLGPAAAEAVLKTTAQRLQMEKAPEDALAFVGGSHFVLLMNHGAQAGQAIARRLLDKIAEPLRVLDTSVNCGASAGFSIYPEDGEEAQTLLRRASAALAVAARLGGNSVRRFQSSMQIDGARRLELEVMLREALQNRQLELAFQPQVTLKTGETKLVETLLRWRHPVRGLISPVEFIPVAEESGLIVPIGEWVMHTACRQASRLLRINGHAPQFAVNVSPLQFQRANMVEVVERALLESGLPPEYLEIEITESVLLGDTDDVLVTLRQLRKLGVEVALDDFGTGYSSLSYLTRFQCDRLKIDRSFVLGMDRERNGVTIVAAIIAMAHALNIRVTAEGVETAEQAERLRALDCDEVQGFYFARPMNARALENILAPLQGAGLLTNPPLPGRLS